MALRCETCVHLKLYGWTGEYGLYHCRACHRHWTGTKQAHCKNCHKHFSSNRACDLHRRHGKCLRPEKVAKKDGTLLLAVRDDKYGPTWCFAEHRVVELASTDQISGEEP